MGGKERDMACYTVLRKASSHIRWILLRRQYACSEQAVVLRGETKSAS